MQSTRKYNLLEQFCVLFHWLALPQLLASTMLPTAFVGLTASNNVRKRQKQNFSHIFMAAVANAF